MWGGRGTVARPRAAAWRSGETGHSKNNSDVKIQSETTTFISVLYHKDTVGIYPAEVVRHGHNTLPNNAV